MDLKAALNGEPGILETSKASAAVDSTAVETNMPETNTASE
jgi:hypothetical protein